MWTSLDPNFHDGIVQSLNVDIASKQTQLVLKQWSGLGDGHYTLSTLTFTDVAWQDFRDFNTFNCVWGIEFSQEFADFEKLEKEYLNRMRGYIAPGELDAISNNSSLIYYSIISTAGIDGFIISEKLAFTEQQF
jgi:hypothetical protein